MLVNHASVGCSANIHAAARATGRPPMRSPNTYTNRWVTNETAICGIFSEKKVPNKYLDSASAYGYAGEGSQPLFDTVRPFPAKIWSAIDR